MKIGQAKHAGLKIERGMKCIGFSRSSTFIAPWGTGLLAKLGADDWWREARKAGRGGFWGKTKGHRANIGSSLDDIINNGQHVEAVRGRQAASSSSLRHKRDATGTKSRR